MQRLSGSVRHRQGHRSALAAVQARARFIRRMQTKIVTDSS